jgi:hypothetical protein
MDATTRDVARRRADNRCKYCLLPQAHSELTHHIEHIFPQTFKMHDNGVTYILV